jgi:hypothetical protein
LRSGHRAIEAVVILAFSVRASTSPASSAAQEGGASMVVPFDEHLFRLIAWEQGLLLHGTRRQHVRMSNWLLVAPNILLSRRPHEKVSRLLLASSTLRISLLCAMVGASAEGLTVLGQNTLPHVALHLLGDGEKIWD